MAEAALSSSKPPSTLLSHHRAIWALISLELKHKSQAVSQWPTLNHMPIIIWPLSWWLWPGGWGVLIGQERVTCHFRSKVSGLSVCMCMWEDTQGKERNNLHRVGMCREPPSWVGYEVGQIDHLALRKKYTKSNIGTCEMINKTRPYAGFSSF